jgi:hypothetical protein
MNEADPDNNIFLVEKLLDRRWHKKRVEYLVKWLNFPDSENTWEPKANINPRLVDQYDNENGGPINGPPLKAPKTPKRATPQTTTSPSQRGRPRAPPKPRDETRNFSLILTQILNIFSLDKHQNSSSSNRRSIRD